VLVRLDLSTCTPTVEDRVQLLAPLASVKPVGADPYFEMLPKALVAAAVPVPEVVPPALSIVSEMELSSVPVTVSVPLEVAADAFVENAARAKRIIKNNCRCIFSLLNLGRFVLRFKDLSALRRRDFSCHWFCAQDAVPETVPVPANTFPPTIDTPFEESPHAHHNQSVIFTLTYRSSLMCNASLPSRLTPKGWSVQNDSGVIAAVQYVRRMRGGAQAHLLQCSDSKNYVVKFINNPQGTRILANEFIFSSLARLFGFSIPSHRIVAAEDPFIRANPQLSIWVPPNQLIPCQAGLHFGCEYVVDPLRGKIMDWVSGALPAMRNPQDFVGMLLLDKWTCNRDQRQAVLWRHCREKKYTASFIDHGWCFGATDWEFDDGRLYGEFSRHEVYSGVTGWDSFEPWLSKLEALNPAEIWGAVENTPPIWYQNDWTALEQLAEQLIARRGIVRSLIEEFRFSVRNPFPKWGERL
jgi:hypothetical protein